MFSFIRQIWSRITSPQIHARKKLAEQTANTALTALRDGNWQALQQQFLPLLRYFITEKLLENAWRLVESNFGPLEHIGSPTCSVGWITLTASVPVHFKRARLNTVLRLTFSGHLFGIGMSPFTWSPPKYADINSIRSINMSFGNWLSKTGGTLTLPAREASEQKYPCVILLGGSGPADRDSTVGALKPFKDIALGLTTNKIAVCRIDKTGFTYRYWYRLFGFNKQKYTLTQEYGYVLHAIESLKRQPEISADKIFIVGHSLGGLMAAHIAETNDSVAGCILMATPTDSMYRCLIRQVRYLASIGENPGSLGGLVSNLEDFEKQADLADSSELSLSTLAEQLPFGLGPNYWLECRSLNPIKTTKELQKPVLILQGGRDYQVTVDNYNELQSSLQSNAHTAFRLYESLNHCFVSGQGPSRPAEYTDPGNVEYEVIQDISQWVKEGDMATPI
ncbi:hypothetical protein EIK77_008845 [Talaromyces pinophilus]|nr:hypothetical protein EIK77_008845 [Talaromyces pinophilus]PCG91955.1 Hypothetical protein PENO1_091070 [Penicillium occitanis (nom. inval.)]PCG99099.1 hypothetical protein PENOC_060040 [Penicillium occitanis (nom. inval.)]